MKVDRVQSVKKTYSRSVNLCGLRLSQALALNAVRSSGIMVDQMLSYRLFCLNATAEYRG